MQQEDPEFDTPILFLIFNRPDLTEKVFGQIRKIRPKQLFIGADGPRKDKPGEDEKCQATRQLVLDMIDWDCEVKTLFREENLGCGLAVSQAITWFFEHVEMGIILEDDCYPDLSFFLFCHELLNYYKDDKRVMMVSGTNLLTSTSIESSYLFSKIGTIWGWASWRRSWDFYDYQLSFLEGIKQNGEINNINISKNELNQRLVNAQKVKDGIIDTWDYQWTFARLINNGLSIISSNNLVSNIGCNEEGTHIQIENNPFANLSTQKFKLPLRHPKVVCANIDYDMSIEKKIYPIKKKDSFLRKTATKVKSQLKYHQTLNLYSKKDIKIHLGCGSRKVNGWINIDLQNSDLNMDLSKGNLPFKSESTNFVVSQHFFEHLQLDTELIPLLKEVFRILKPNGELWFSVPSIKKIATGYLEDRGQRLLQGRQERFPGYSLNGKPDSHIINEIFYQNGEHKNLFDYELINWMLTKTGFSKVVEENEKTFLEKFSDFQIRNDDDVSIYCSAIKTP